MPRINFNAPAMTNVNRLNQLEKGLKRSMEHIASGLRINRPSDDVAAHGVSEHLRGQIRSMHAASRNVQDGIALINVAEAALHEVHSMLHRMRELAVQSANDTNNDVDRSYIQVEVERLKTQIDFIADTTHYNGHKLLNGAGEWGKGKGGSFQMGPNTLPSTDFIRHKIPEVSTETLGLADVRMDKRDDAAEAIDMIKGAVEVVNGVRANLGGIANRLEESWKNTEKMIEGNQSYESKLKDTDFAEEMINVTRDQIISQYCNAMLAQANQTPQSILQLLR